MKPVIYLIIIIVMLTQGCSRDGDDSVESSIQGILIKYKSGIWGGLFIESEMHPEIQEIDLESGLDIYGIKSTKQPVIATTKDLVVPPNKNVRIFCSFTTLNISPGE